MAKEIAGWISHPTLESLLAPQQGPLHLGSESRPEDQAEHDGVCGESLELNPARRGPAGKGVAGLGEATSFQIQSEGDFYFIHQRHTWDRD